MTAASTSTLPTSRTRSSSDSQLIAMAPNARLSSENPTLTMSARPSKTASQTQAIAEKIFQRIVTIGDKRYLLWASATVNGKQVSVGASAKTWKGIEENLPKVLGSDDVQKVKTQINIALEGDTLTIKDHANSNRLLTTVQAPSSSTSSLAGTATTKDNSHSKVIAAFRSFQKNMTIATSYTPPTMTSSSPAKANNENNHNSQTHDVKGMENSKILGASGTSSKHLSSIVQGPPLSQEELASREIARELVGNVDSPIDSTTLLAGLQHIQKQSNGDNPPIAIHAPNENIPGSERQQKTAWAVSTGNKWSGISAAQLLSSCRLQDPITKPIYLPIRTNYSHYVGLVVTPERQVIYYDSFGRGYNFSHDSKKTALQEAIDSFCTTNNLILPEQNQYITDPTNAHQQDHVQCGLYQMRWYQHMCVRELSRNRNTGIAGTTPYGYQTSQQEMQSLRLILNAELTGRGSLSPQASVSRVASSSVQTMRTPAPSITPKTPPVTDATTGVKVTALGSSSTPLISSSSNREDDSEVMEEVLD